jgi:hypothetical protein
MEVEAAESSIVAEKCFEDFDAKVTGRLASICKAYARHISNLGGICDTMRNETPPAEHYLRWMEYEVAILPFTMGCRQLRNVHF